MLQAFAYGIFTSMQYTSMNTLAYADLTEPQTSNGSSIASTMQSNSPSPSAWPQRGSPVG